MAAMVTAHVAQHRGALPHTFNYTQAAAPPPQAPQAQQQQQQHFNSDLGLGGKRVSNTTTTTAKSSVSKSTATTVTTTTSSTDDLDIKQFVPALACVLCQITQRNDKLALDSTQLTAFHASRAPSIPVQAYLERLVKYAYCSSECFVLAIIYLDRIIQRNTSFLFTSLNVHRLLITAVMIAAKFFDDSYYNNAYYARVGGIPTAELNTLELKFLSMIDFSLHVTPDLFYRYKRELLMYIVPPPPSPTLSPCASGSSSSSSASSKTRSGMVPGSSSASPHSPIHSHSPPPVPVSPKSPLNLSDVDSTFRRCNSTSPCSAVVSFPVMVASSTAAGLMQQELFPHYHHQHNHQHQQNHHQLHHHPSTMLGAGPGVTGNGSGVNSMMMMMMMATATAGTGVAPAATPTMAAPPSMHAFHQPYQHQHQQQQTAAHHYLQPPQPAQQTYVGLVHPFPQRIVHAPHAQPAFPQYTHFIPQQQQEEAQAQQQQFHILQQAQPQMPQRQTQQIYVLHASAPASSPSCIVAAPTAISQQQQQLHQPSRIAQIGSAMYSMPVFDY